MSAQIGQLQAHLPPADTLDAILLTRSGISGTFSLSFGTTFSDSTIAIACRHGTVTVSDRGKKVTVRHVPNPPPTNANDDTTGTTNHPTGPTMTDREVKDHRQDQWTKEFDQGSGVKEELSSWAQHLLDQAGMATTTTVGDTNEVRRGSRGRGGHGSNDDNNDDDDDKNIIKQDDRQSPEEALADLILVFISPFFISPFFPFFFFPFPFPPGKEIMRVYSLSSVWPDSGLIIHLLTKG